MSSEREAAREARRDRDRIRKIAAKHAQQNVETLNRLRKLIPGDQRRWRLENIAAEMRGSADWMIEEAKLAGSIVPTEIIESIRADALFLERLAWDMHAARLALRGPSQATGRKYPDALGPRP